MILFGIFFFSLVAVAIVFFEKTKPGKKLMNKIIKKFFS